MVTLEKRMLTWEMKVGYSRKECAIAEVRVIG